MVKTDTVKGFKDYLGEEALKKRMISEIIEKEVLKYGFEPAETPVIEYEQFVRGDQSQEGDEAISDIFKLNDKGQRKLALRYEFTFQLKRISKNKKLPYKRYTTGPVFRDEPAKANRFRQFTQFDADIIGSTIKDEAEILAMTSRIMDKLGIQSKIFFNNRKLINEILSEYGVDESKRPEVIRIIDKLDKKSEDEVGAELEKYTIKNLLSEFTKPAEYYDKYASYKEVKEIMSYLRYYGVRKVEFLPTLARGLGYYNGTVFEVKTSGDNKIRETITAGGSFMFNQVQSTGISFGVERLMSLIDLDKFKLERPDVLIVSLGEDKASVELSEKLRNNGSYRGTCLQT